MAGNVPNLFGELASLTLPDGVPGIARDNRGIDAKADRAENGTDDRAEYANGEVLVGTGIVVRLPVGTDDFLNRRMRLDIRILAARPSSGTRKFGHSYGKATSIQSNQRLAPTHFN